MILTLLRECAILCCKFEDIGGSIVNKDNPTQREKTFFQRMWQESLFRLLVMAIPLVWLRRTFFPDTDSMLFAILFALLIVIVDRLCKQQQEGKTNNPDIEDCSVLQESDTPPCNLEQIAKLKSLLDDGAITQEEFDAKKQQLLEL